MKKMKMKKMGRFYFIDDNMPLFLERDINYEIITDFFAV